MKRFLLLILCGAACARAGAGEAGWLEVVRAMPVPPDTRLNRDNAIDVILDAFRSNTVVKAIVILPGVADDFYLIHRDAPALNLRATNLLGAITALTNATAVRASFLEPFLLLHVQRDVLEPVCVSADRTATRGLREGFHLPSVQWKDAHWETLQPVLQRALSRSVRPDGPSPDAWHFNRHNLAGWGLSDWELLKAVSLAGGTGVTVQKRAIVFDVRRTP